MKKILILLAVGSLLSCECGNKDSKSLEVKQYSKSDITKTYYNGIKKGRQEIRDSLALINTEHLKLSLYLMYLHIMQWTLIYLQELL